MRETFHEKLAFHGYSAARKLSEVAPQRLGRRLFRIAGRIAFGTGGKARATVSANMAQILGLPVGSKLVQAATREAFDSYAAYWFETFRLPVMPDAEIEKRMSIHGADHVFAALERGGGVIVATPHMGNWDAVGRYFALKGCKIVAVAEALEPRRLLDLFVQHRADIGMKIIPLEQGSSVTRRLVEHLADNWLVGLVADRELSGKGVEVEMFGSKRRLPAGPAALSLSTGAPLVVGALYSEGGEWNVRLTPLAIDPTGDRRVDVPRLTEAMAAEFERSIAAGPTDWHMFQPAWP